MKFNSKFITLFLFYVLFVVLPGCGEKLPPGMPRLNPCTITVKMDGHPVENAKIILSSETVKYGCTGFTNASGSTKMLTDGKYNGIPAGKYKVLVSRIDVEQREYKGFIEEAKLPPKKRTVIIDLKYEDPDETPFEIEVVDGKRASLECEVTPPENPELPADYGMPKPKKKTK